ncbi:MAG: tRNA (adenosine(37)-N6)-threonylcarbamoyltransferase complex dimerization subunit type 1 TsaB [Anaerolineales bacterium]|jgi:tRNA threonylcarbamoyladenosine biosynthesis protein TsaB
MLLAVDTSTRTIGLALYREDRVLHESSWISQNYHTMQLAPAVQAAIEQAGEQVSSLEAVAVATGPGSFTGLRIGVAFAKGLALARRVPLIGIPSLDILAAAQIRQDLPMFALLQAGRGRLAVQQYKVEKGNWRATGELEVLTAEALGEKVPAPAYVCGELNEAERRSIRRGRRNVVVATPAWAIRRPALLAELAWKRLQAGSTDDPVALSPIYLHHGDPIAS